MLIYTLMLRRLLPNLSSRILLLMLIIVLILPAVAAVCATEPYPPMLPGHTAGSVTGRVTTNTSQPMAGVTVYIVNAASSSIQYSSSTTDSNGYFAIASVNSTNGSPVYRILATEPGYDDATSSAFAVSPATTSIVYVTMTRNYSIATPTPTPVPSPGAIAGTVIDSNTTRGVINAKVSLVKANHQYVTITSAITDSNGRYRFSGVEYIDAPGYKLRVEKTGYEEIFTAPIMIVPDSTVTQDIYLTPVASSNGATQNATATPGPTVTAEPPTATPAPQTNSAGLPGFGIASALAGVTLAYALARKK
ncbi:carboxypeptidase-like regulatory domain-containing protein [Methanocella arvoryzae]|uniref:carboxypeptidase-like regulatory domain-containing protein n=1 Tax=Methanocella arvoryzae TaxID=1175445 RepID=UPI00130512DF|nr:carboxypeptidase-like regulatory domain-containing protein [Methanocella arvoryzae]